MKASFRKQGRSSGSATVEFAIISPVLIMAVLSTADVGFAIHESFEIDQAIRNGAELALRDIGEAAVEDILIDATGESQYATTWDVARMYACPENPSNKSHNPGDLASCVDNRPTAIFYDITGVRSYPGIVLGSRDLTRSASVQIR